MYHVIVFNFSIHYLLDNITNIIKVLKKKINYKGLIIITTNDY